MTKKAVISVIMSLILLFSSGGLFLTFIIKQTVIRSEIRNRIKSGLPKNSLTIIKKHKNEAEQNILLKWLREKEFSYNGKMFDVVSREIHGDSVWYYCLLDEKETGLFSKMKLLTHNELNNDKNFMGLLAKMHRYLAQNFLNEISDKPIYIQDPKIVRFTSYSFSVKIYVDSPDTPPPENLYSGFSGLII